MTEQQRVLLAVGLTFIIFWVWQVVLGQIDPPVNMEPQQVAAEQAAPSVGQDKAPQPDTLSGLLILVKCRKQNHECPCHLNVSI